MSKTMRLLWTFLVVCMISMAGMAEAQYDERLNCDGTPHEGGETPNTEEIGETEDDNACHGQPGDSGQCTISSSGVVSSVSCFSIEKPFGQTSERCSAISDCGSPSVGDIVCGSDGTEAFAGTDPATGKGFVQCQLGSTITRADCP